MSSEKSIQDALEEKKEILLDEVADAILQISSELIAKNSTDTGHLLGSGDIEKGINERRVTYRSPYGAHVEYGSRPHRPPVEPLERWAQRKLGKKGLGWAIAKKIEKEGVEPAPFLRPAVDRVRRDLRYANLFSFRLNQSHKLK